MASTSSSQHRCVFVGNIPYDATEEQLIQICEEVGPVVSFRLVLDRETGKPKGYGFCEYKDEETALSARRNLQGYEINGRQLRVDFAENDKGADRNREQGRSGTGLTSGTDAQKSLNGYPIGGDAVLQQPFGVPLAASAASLIVEALNGSQASGLLQPKSSLLSVSGSATDSLTLYLAKFSRHQLNEIITEMKAFAAKDKALAQQLLKRVPQLPKALFQALIMLGMVNPQMMQMASKSSEAACFSVQDIHQDLKPVLPLCHGQVPSQTKVVEKFLRPSEPLERNILASAAVFQSSSLPSKLVPLSAHQPPLVKNQIPTQGTASVVSGVPMHLNIQAGHLPTFGISLPQEQPSLLHHHRPIRVSNISDHPQAAQPRTNVLQPLLAHPSTSQFASLNHPMLLSGIELLSKETKASRSSLDLTSTSKVCTRPSSSMGLVKHNEIAIEETRLTNHVSKHPRSEERAIPHKLIGGSSSLADLAQSSDSSLLDGRQKSCTDCLQDLEKRIPQLSSEEESALLQQLMNLTPEQLCSLPPEQQQQVLVIQQTLRSKALM